LSIKRKIGSGEVWKNIHVVAAAIKEMSLKNSMLSWRSIEKAREH
jgi:hypothetical protein